MIGNKGNAVNEMMLCDLQTWSMEKLEGKGRFHFATDPIVGMFPEEQVVDSYLRHYALKQDQDFWAFE